MAKITKENKQKLKELKNELSEQEIKQIRGFLIDGISFKNAVGKVKTYAK